MSIQTSARLSLRGHQQTVDEARNSRLPSPTLSVRAALMSPYSCRLTARSGLALRRWATLENRYCNVGGANHGHLAGALETAELARGQEGHSIREQLAEPWSRVGFWVGI